MIPLRNLASALVLAFVCVHASAQPFPTRSVTVIMPAGPGTAGDSFARALAGEAAKLLGQPIVYENRVGANQRLAITAMKSAPADGYLLALAPDPQMVAQPLLDPAMKMRLGEDYVPIALVHESPLILVAHPSVPFRDVQGLVAYAKAHPGKLNFSVIQGAVSHVVAAMFLYSSGIAATVVPYNLSTQQMADLAAGRVDLMISSSTIKPFVDTGKVVPLAATGRERWQEMPALQTFTEAGVPVAASFWFALIARAGTSREVIARLASAFNEARKQPAMQKLYASYGFAPTPYLTPEEIGDKIRAQMQATEPAIRKAGIKFE